MNRNDKIDDSELVRLGIERVRSALPRVAEVPLGGTAVGTGINTPAGFPQLVIELLQQETELPITEAVVRVCHEGESPAQMVKEIMSREAKPE